MQRFRPSSTIVEVAPHWVGDERKHVMAVHRFSGSVQQLSSVPVASPVCHLLVGLTLQTRSPFWATRVRDLLCLCYKYIKILGRDFPTKLIREADRILQFYYSFVPAFCLYVRLASYSVLRVLPPLLVVFWYTDSMLKTRTLYFLYCTVPILFGLYGLLIISLGYMMCCPERTCMRKSRPSASYRGHGAKHL